MLIFVDKIWIRHLSGHRRKRQNIDNVPFETRTHQWKKYIATMNVTRVGPIKYIFRLNGVKIIAQPFRSNYGVQSVFRAFPGNKSKIDCRPERCQQWALNAGYRVKNGDRGRRPLGSCWSQIDGIVDYNGRTVFGRFMAFGKVVNNVDDRPFRIGWLPIIIR